MAPGDVSFGGGRSIDITPPSHYQRMDLPAADADEFGGNDEDSEIDESAGRGVLSFVAVQKRSDGVRVGVTVRGGGKYNVVKRGRYIVLTLFDTRAGGLDVRRTLDVRSLGTSVLRVLPTVEEDTRYRMELSIELSQPAAARVKVEDEILWIYVDEASARR